MIYLEYILWGYFIGYPVYVYFTHEQEKQMLIAHPEKLIQVYRETMLYIWVPTALLLVLVSFGDLSFSDLGLQWHWDLSNQVAVAFGVFVTGYFCFQIIQLKNSNQHQQAFIEQTEFVAWLLPKNAREARYFILGVSVSAGLCEELLFRGYLLNLLDQNFPTYVAVIVSSLAFGAVHIYQGPLHVIRTTVIGVFMALVYLITDSIFIVIYLHIIMDMLGGMLAYISHSSQRRMKSKIKL